MWQKQTTQTTLLWYDYETWGANPQRDGIAQFAAVRTDLELNPIGEPIDITCKPSIDMVVDADAVMITGISPLKLLAEGLNEWDFAAQIHSEMSVPGTCTVGYNTIRFDDECTRYLFYRNLHDPYAREWKNGNSRWDILDVVRMTAALRPEGIHWPKHEDGSPSFKLEHLTAANGLSHEKAHDAVSDVFATIAMAKLIKEKQPKLFGYAFQLRSKHEVKKHLDVINRTPHLHFSGKIPALEHCLGIEMPIMVHPERSNEIIVLDIRKDPTWLLKHSAEQLKEWLFSKKEDLPSDIERPPLRTIHINRSPMIAPMSLLDTETISRLDLNLEQINQHRQQVNNSPLLIDLVRELYSLPHEHANQSQDPQHALYSGFIDDHDRNVLNRMVHNQITKEQWLAETHILHDDRLEPLIENILARHFPECLDSNRLSQWKKTKAEHLVKSDFGQKLTIEDASTKVQSLLELHPDNQSLSDTQQYLAKLNETFFADAAINLPIYTDSDKIKAELENQIEATVSIIEPRKNKPTLEDSNHNKANTVKEPVKKDEHNSNIDNQLDLF